MNQNRLIAVFAAFVAVVCLTSGARADNPDAVLNANDSYGYATFANPPDGNDEDQLFTTAQQANHQIKAKFAWVVYGDDGSRIEITNNVGQCIHSATVTGRIGTSLYTVQGAFAGGGGGTASPQGTPPAVSHPWTADYETDPNAGVRLEVTINPGPVVSLPVVPLEGTALARVKAMVQVIVPPGGSLDATYPVTLTTDSPGRLTFSDVPTKVTLGQRDDVFVAAKDVELVGLAEGQVELTATDDNGQLESVVTGGEVASITGFSVTIPSARSRRTGQPVLPDETSDRVYDAANDFDKAVPTFQTMTKNACTLTLTARGDTRNEPVTWHVRPWPDLTSVDGSPAVPEVDTATNTVGTNCRGAYYIDAFIDANRNKVRDKNETGHSFRIVVVDVRVTASDKRYNSNRLHGSADDPHLVQTWADIGDEINDKTKNLMWAEATVRVEGGGKAKQLGVDRVRVGWIQNLRGIVPYGEYTGSLHSRLECDEPAAAAKQGKPCQFPQGAPHLDVDDYPVLANRTPIQLPILDASAPLTQDCWAAFGNFNLPWAKTADRTVRTADSPEALFPTRHPFHDQPEIAFVRGGDFFTAYLCSSSDSAKRTISVHGAQDWAVNYVGQVSKVDNNFKYEPDFAGGAGSAGSALQVYVATKSVADAGIELGGLIATKCLAWFYVTVE